MLKSRSRLTPVLALAAAAALPLMSMAQTTEQALPEGVLAIVNGHPILQITVASVEQQIKDNGEQADPASILEELINLEVLTQAAEELELDKEPEISAALQLQYTQTMANAYLARKGAEMTFSDDELQAEYAAQSSNVDRGEFRASHILAETLEQARQAIAQLQAGRTFSEVAREYSIDANGESGGDLGWFVGASMEPEFAEAIAQMEIGEISEKPVKTAFGYHVLNLVDKRDAALPRFETVRSGLTSLAVRRALSEHVEALKADADIRTQ